MFYKKYERFKDSLLKVQNKSEIKDIQEKYETEKKTLENEQLREMNKVNSKVIQNQRIIGAVVIFSMILAIVFALTIFRSKRRLRTAYQSLQDLNHKVLDQKKQLEESNQTKDKMFSIIAHDLRGPFSSMMGFLQMINDEYKDFDDEQKVHMLQITYEQSLTTYSLLENLLQWSLSQRGMVEYHPEDINLYMLVENQLDIFKYRASNKNLILENSVKSNLTVCLDVNMITSVIRNLLGNALKFTPHGGKISLSSFETKKGVAIQIIDTGVGMPAEIIQGFESGARIESTKGTENESGTGLGLEIVKDFAHKMKVEIQIKSKEGIGTEFILVLPSEVTEK
jgi:signal transduction histidine kinase